MCESLALLGSIKKNNREERTILDISTGGCVRRTEEQCDGRPRQIQELK